MAGRPARRRPRPPQAAAPAAHRPSDGRRLPFGGSAGPVRARVQDRPGRTGQGQRTVATQGTDRLRPRRLHHRLREPSGHLPRGQSTTSWVQTPAMAPYIASHFRPRQCDPCPVRASCTRGRAARSVYFLPQHLHELQARNRADQQDPAWRKLYALRSGAEGTVAELALGHQARRCRYHGLPKTHVQHVLTAIAVNIERLTEQVPWGTTYRPRRPTAFQEYLESHGLHRALWWRQGK
ncbi:transposase [Streptomyces sp. NPDC102360]|uniref:transposase n=1 Tax=Streptomyces sp. NPDC102360 TaxID=3366160 RepID=UPI0037F85224